jgi:hypothetical protein
LRASPRPHVPSVSSNQTGVARQCAALFLRAETPHDDARRLELYPAVTTLRGAATDCIRIRPPRQQELPVKLTPAPKPKKAKAAAMAEADNGDLGDDIHDIPFFKR